MSSDHKPFLFIVSAPSGCGKSTLLKSLFSKVDGLAFSISHTTRSPRPGEVDGIDYNFISSVVFAEMQVDEKFVEFATVHGNSYGTSIHSINSFYADGLDVILDIDVQGMLKVKSSKLFDTVTVFILPPDINELEARLRKRGTDSETVISLRLKNAVSEINHAQLYDYTIVNRDISIASEQLATIVKSERLRSNRTFAL